MNKWGIRHQVLFLALVPTVTISLLLGTYFTSTRIQDLEQSFRKHGEAIAFKLAPAGEYGVFSHNKPLLQNLAEITLNEHDVKSVTFYTVQGTELAHAGNSAFAFTIPAHSQTLNTHLYLEENDEAVAFIVPITTYNQADLHADLTQLETLMGWLKIELDTKSKKISEYQLILHASLIFLLGLSLSGLHAFQMGNNVTRPIIELSEAVKRIKEGDLSTRIQPIKYPELSILGSGINIMVETLQNSHVELQNKIDQTTFNLRRSLETIEVQNIELDIARKAAEAANQIKSEFLADMSHEVRTPLNGVIGFINLLQKTELSSKQTDYLNIIQKSANNLLLIINDILDISKIEAGKLRIEHTLIDIRECVEDTLTLLAPNAHEKNLALIPLIYSDVPTQVLGDALRIKQIITNLVSNSIKFTDQGNITVRVMLEKETPSQALIRISVSDPGIGLTQTEQKNLFQAFSQVKIGTARKSGGTGLGLVICKKLVEQMNGTIGLESEPLKGSTFWFTFQVDKYFDVIIANEKNFGLIANTPANLSLSKKIKTPWHILAVDDNLLNLKLITALLEDMGIKTTAVDSGNKAIECIRSNVFDLIFMDIRMPHMNGIEATNQIRKIETSLNRKSTPIIALTAHALLNEREALLKTTGIDDCLIKPIDETALKIVMYKWIKRDEPIKVIDWDLAYKLTSGKKDLARELFEKLTESLPNNKTQINEAYLSKNWDNLRDFVHYLHGACCYCGVPQLKRCAQNLESAVDTRTPDIIKPRLDALNQAIDDVLLEYV